MSRLGLLWRSLCHHRATSAAMAAAVAVAVAVLVGSLVVGDSVRGSLRGLALERLGAVTHALRAPGFLWQELGEALGPEVVPLLVLDGAVRSVDGAEGLPRVQVLGVSSGFWALEATTPDPPPEGRKVLLTRTLARDLGVEPGEAFVLTLPVTGQAPVGSYLGRRGREDTVRILRVTCGGLLPDEGTGRFSLQARLGAPATVFVELRWLQERLDVQGRVNTLLATRSVAEEQLVRAQRLEDHGVTLVDGATTAELWLQGRRVVVPDQVVAAAHTTAVDRGMELQRTSVYLATELRRDREGEPSASMPYSVVAGVEAGGLTLVEGSPSPDLGPDEILLNTWAAADLQARVGDRIHVRYLISTPDGALRDGDLKVTLRGVVRMEGLAVASQLVPPFEGLTDADTMADWDPPFPIDLERIRPRDEAYWDEYRTAPRAFLSLERVRDLWQAGGGSPGGWVTALRLRSSGGQLSPAQVEGELLRRLSPAAAGLQFRPVREEALAAAHGSTDYGVLFLSMSIFLLAAAAGLVALTVRLGVQRRAAQQGLLLATGWTPGQAGRVLLAEGLLAALPGVVLGAPLGLGYAALLIHGLATWWRGAVGQHTFTLHASPVSLVIGAGAGATVALLAIWWGLRILRRSHVTQLLAGWEALEAWIPAGGRRRGMVVGLAALGFALLMVVLGLLPAGVSPVAAFFAGGALLLVGGLALAGAILGRCWSTGPGGLSAAGLALRGAARARQRSVLTLGLLACASFLIVTVAASRQDLRGMAPREPGSGAGGFPLVGRLSLPLHVDPSTPAGQEALGLTTVQREALRGTQLVPMRLGDGEAISCLNLQQPATPRVLGIPVSLRQPGRFGFVRPRTPSANPWELLEKELPDGVIPCVAEAASAQWILKVGLGDEVRVPGSRGEEVRLRLVGLLEPCIFAGELLVAEEHLTRLLPVDAGYRVLLVAPPEGREEPVARVLREVLGELGLDLQRSVDVLERFAAVQNTYLATFEALGGLGLLLGTLGLVTVLLRSVLERRRELALLLALGLRRRQLVGILLLEHGGLLLTGLLLGAASALVAVAPHLHSARADVGWGTLLLTLGGCLLVGLTASALAAVLALRLPLLPALRRE